MEQAVDKVPLPREKALRPKIPDNLYKLNPGQIEKLRQESWNYYNNWFHNLPQKDNPHGSVHKQQSADLDKFFPGQSTQPFGEVMAGEPGMDKFSETRLAKSDQEFFSDIDQTAKELIKIGRISQDDLDQITQLNKDASKDAVKYLELNKKAEPIWEAMLEKGYNHHDLAA